MKKILITVFALTVGATGLALGQQAAQGAGQTMGRGRGGAPCAWNDKNKDGICDVTGKAVGQRQGRSARGMRGRGRAFAGGAGRGFGRGMGRGMGFFANQQSNAAPAAK